MADALSGREQEVFDLHEQGLKNVEIAEMLGIKPGTVSNALTSALRKLGREDEIAARRTGGNGPSTAGGALDPQSMFKREGAKVLRRAKDTAEAVENYPETFEGWLTENRESLEKDFANQRERLVSQADAASKAREEWVTFAERLDIDLEEVEAESESEETAAAVAADDESQDEQTEEEPTA